MAGVTALRKIQLGREVTAGTAVAATTVWRGMGAIEDDQTIEFPEEQIGILGGTTRSYIPQLNALLELESVPATFEQIAHLFEMGIMEATPTQDGTGTDYIYAYTLPTTALNTIKTYTVEGGNNQQAVEMEYAFAEAITLEGTAGEAMMMSATLRGRQVANTTFTGALTVPTVEEILASKGKLYLDAIGGSFGSTQVTNTLIAVTVNIATGIMQKFTFDGQLYFSFIQYTAPEITVDVTFEHNASAETEITAWRNQTARLMRLEFEGSTVGTPGTTYSNKTLLVDLAGKWENFDALSSQDGNDIVTATFRSRYDATAADWGTITVVNELTTLP